MRVSCAKIQAVSYTAGRKRPMYRLSAGQQKNAAVKSTCDQRDGQLDSRLIKANVQVVSWTAKEYSG